MRAPHRSPRPALLSVSLSILMLLGATACEERVTGPKFDLSAPNFDIDVTPGTMAFDVNMNGVALAGFGPNHCAFRMYVDPTPPQNLFGQYVRDVCTNTAGTFAATVPNLPVGTHTFELRFFTVEALGNDPTPVVARATVTLDATTQATASFDVSATMGVVAGTFTVDGQPVPNAFRYSVCAATGGQYAPCAQAAAATGAFKLLDRPGDRVGFVRSGQGFTFSPGAPISFFNYNVVAGSTTDVPQMALVTSRLAPTFRFGAQSLASLNVFTFSCPLTLHVDRPAGHPPFHFGPRVAFICDNSFASPQFADMPVGDHTFELRFEGPPPTVFDQRAIVGVAQVSLSAGATATADFNLADAMGLVKGKLTTASWAGPLQQYEVCLAASGFIWPCIRPRVSADGSEAAFAFLDLPGDRTALVRRHATQATVGTLTYTVAVGGTNDLGAVSDRPPLLLQFKFDGAPLDGLGAGFVNWNCPFWLYRDPPNAFSFGTFVRSLCADETGSLAAVPIADLTPGQHVINVRYSGPPLTGQPNALIATATVLIEAGKTFTQPIELKDQMGLVSGTLKIDGQVPPANERFQVCARHTAGFGGPCAWVDPVGLFKYVDLPGARSGLVKVFNNSVAISDFGYSVVAGQTTIVGTTTGGAHGETPTGTDVKVTPVESSSGGTPVGLTFTNVGAAGLTTVSGSESPGGFGAPPPPDADAVTLYYEIATSATFTGLVEVCINYPAGIANPERLQLLHYEINEWTDVTTSHDLVNRVICGKVSSFSPFVVAMPKNLAPVAVIRWSPGVVSEGLTVTFNGLGSEDDGTIAKYEWDLNNDGTFDAEGPSVTRVFPDNGPVTLSLKVHDNLGVTNTTTATLNVSNVVPTVAIPGAAPLIKNETFTGAGSFADPGADSWTATVSYGEGTPGSLVLAGKSFQLSHTYLTAGQFTITVNVADDDNGTGTGTVVVVVQSHQEAVGALIASLAGVLATKESEPLIHKLEQAIKQLDRRHYEPATNQIEAYIEHVETLVQSRHLSSAQGTALTEAANRVIRAIRLENPDDDEER